MWKNMMKSYWFSTSKVGIGHFDIFLKWSSAAWLRTKVRPVNWRKNFKSTEFSLYWGSYHSHMSFLEHCTLKIYLLRNIYPDATQISLDWSINPFSEDFTCLSSGWIYPSSDKWNPLKKSTNSWFGAQLKERLCFNQVRSV